MQHCWWAADRAAVGLETGTRRIAFKQLPDLAAAVPWGGAVPEEGTAVIHEMHQDCVTELPEKALLLASSLKTRVEIWAYQSHVLGIQGAFPKLLTLETGFSSFETREEGRSRVKSMQCCLI